MSTGLVAILAVAITLGGAVIIGLIDKYLKKKRGKGLQ